MEKTTHFQCENFKVAYIKSKDAENELKKRDTCAEWQKKLQTFDVSTGEYEGYTYFFCNFHTTEI